MGVSVEFVDTNIRILVEQLSTFGLILSLFSFDGDWQACMRREDTVSAKMAGAVVRGG